QISVQELFAMSSGMSYQLLAYLTNGPLPDPMSPGHDELCNELGPGVKPVYWMAEKLVTELCSQGGANGLFIDPKDTQCMIYHDPRTDSLRIVVRWHPSRPAILVENM